MLIEDKASSTQLIQELVADGLHSVTRYEQQADKIIRMHAQTAMIENGFVHLPKEAGWLADQADSNLGDADAFTERYGYARTGRAGRGTQGHQRRAGAGAISGVPRRYRDSP